MKITRKNLRKLILKEMADYFRWKSDDSTHLGGDRSKRYIRRRRTGTSREEAGEYRQRFKMPERGMRPSHNGYLAMQVMNLPKEQYETMLGELEAKHGDIHSWDVNAKIVYFRDGHQEKLA